MEKSWGQRQHEDFLKRWAQDDWDRHRRARSRRPEGLLTAMVLAGGGLLAAAYLGHSPAEVWNSALITAERFMDAWLNG
ncbi:hypothetical protein GCM10022419_056440 [Nonomuraea rosea]|uniref:DUF4231 domain-containing protein n=1 Tax=Nonomuraea rosea TaxID=638574 RepID=A0ABP6XLH3_9ACTN